MLHFAMSTVRNARIGQDRAFAIEITNGLPESVSWIAFQTYGSIAATLSVTGTPFAQCRGLRQVGDPETVVLGGGQV
jgi:hypothetical protein